MADPSTSGPRRSEALPGAEDDARIEQLLVTGLDHYFAGEFEPAINLWTRVLFLDRAHDRARAYIERARSAQAEQQRESEAMVHEGLAAFDRGDVVRARELLRDALEKGASHDLALGVLGRIDRLDVGQSPVPSVAPGGQRRRRFIRTQPVTIQDGRGRGRFVRAALAAGVTVSIAAGAVWWLAPDAVSLANLWPGSVPVDRPAAALIVAPLPVPAPTEAYVTQARALFAGGKLRDALRALDRVPLGDSLRPDADRLRGQIQRDLLSVAAAGAPVPPPVVSPEARPQE